MAHANLDIRIRVKDDGSVVIDRLTRETREFADAQERLTHRLRASGRYAAEATSAFSRLAFTFRNVVAGMATFYVIDRTTAAFRFMGEELVRVNAEAERTRVMLARLFGDAEAGERAFRWLVELQASGVPFGVSAIHDAFVKLKTAGLDPMAGSLQTILDAVAAMGGTDETLARVTRAIQQMAGKGRVSMEELRQQLGEHIPGAAQTMARELGMSLEEFERAVERAEIRAEEGIAALLRGWRKEFSGAAKDFGDTWTGLTNRMSAEWSQFVRSVGDAGAFDYLRAVVAEVLDEVGQLREDGSLAQWANDLSGQIQSVFESIATGVSREWERTKWIFSTVADAFGQLYAGFRELPTWMQEVGLIGAFLFGAKGKLILAAASLSTKYVNAQVFAYRAMAENLISFKEYLSSTHDELRALVDERGGPGTADRLMGNETPEANRQAKLQALRDTIREQADALEEARRRAEDYAAALRNLEAYGVAIHPKTMRRLSAEEARAGREKALADIRRLRAEKEEAERMLASIAYGYPVDGGSVAGASLPESPLAGFLERVRERMNRPAPQIKGGAKPPAIAPAGPPLWIDPTESTEDWGETWAEKAWNARARAMAQLAKSAPAGVEWIDPVEGAKRFAELAREQEDTVRALTDNLTTNPLRAWKEVSEHQKAVIDEVTQKVREAAEERGRLEEEEARKREQLWRNTTSVAQSVFGDYASFFRQLYEDSGGEQEKYWRAYKRFAIAETITSTAVAAMNAYKALAGIPFVGPALGASAAASIAALGAAKVHLIEQQRPAKAFAEGGVVTGPVVGLVGEAGPEVVLPLDRLPQMVEKVTEKSPTINASVNIGTVGAGADVKTVALLRRVLRAEVPALVRAMIANDPATIQLVRRRAAGV